MALPQVVIDVGFSGPTTGDWMILDDEDRGLLDTGLLGDDDIWVEVTPWVRSWSLRRGATRGDGPQLRYEAGTCTIELNNGDRRFDPTNLSGPYVAGGVSQVVPMVRVRIRAVWDEETYFLFYGNADSWQLSYQATSWSTVTLTATDPSKIFAAIDRLALVSPVGADEDSGARINRLLDTVDWPAEDRVIDTGIVTLQETNEADNLLTELQLVQDTELGDFYFDARGRAVFKNRESAFTATRSTTIQAVFGDGGYVANAELPYADVKIDTDDSTMANAVTVARAGGTAQLAEDAASQVTYLKKTYQRMDLLFTDDDESLIAAQFLLYQASNPELRFSTLFFNTPRPDVEDVLWPVLLSLDFGDRISVTRRPPGGGDPITREVFVRGVEMASSDLGWTTNFTLQSAARYAYLVLDNPSLGTLDNNALGF